jgi:hypothetical protein
VGTLALQVVEVKQGDTVFVAPSLLADVSPASYATAVVDSVALETDPPALVDDAVATTRAGGFDLAWTEPADANGVAGYVVRWRISGPGGYTDSRTVIAPVSRIELRGLGVGTYDVQVFAYDVFGNADRCHRDHRGRRRDMATQWNDDPEPSLQGRRVRSSSRGWWRGRWWLLSSGVGVVTTPAELPGCFRAGSA